MHPGPSSDPDPGTPAETTGAGPGADLTERQRLEQELRHSHERFQAILATTMDGYWRVHLDGRILEVNDAYCQMSGYSRAELLAMTVQQIDALDTPEQVLERSEQVRREGTIRFESKHRAKGGRLLDLDISLTLVPATQEVVAFFRDITERKRAQAALSVSEERFRALVQNSWDILSILDGEGRLVYNSPACERIHGFTPEELLGRPTVDLIHPEDAPRVAGTMGWVLAHPGAAATVEYRYACKDGGWVWMEAVGVNYLDHPAIQGVVVNSRDISERQRSQAALQASESMYRELLERQGEGFGMVDAEERFVIANPVAEAIFGVPPGGLVGRSVLEFLEGPQQHQVQAETQLRQSGASSTYELEIRRADGERRILLVTATPWFVEGREAPLIIGVFRDITETHQAQRALRESEERLSRIYHASYDAIYLTDLATGRYLDVNEAFERITGHPRAQVLGRNSTELGLWFDPGDRGGYYEELQAAGHVRNRLIRIRHREGQEVWAECNSSVLELDGRPCMLSTARDVTMRIQAEIALRESEERFKRLVEAASVPIGIADTQGRIEYLNPRFLQDFAYSREDLPDMAAWWQRAYPDPAYRQRVMQVWHEAEARGLARGGEISMDQIFEVTCGNGQLKQVEIRGALAGDRVIVFMQDLTERMQAEVRLRDALEFSERMLEAQPMGVLAYEASGRCVRVNAAVARVVGTPAPELLAQNFRELQSWKDSGLLAAAELALATGTQQHLETRVRTTFGRNRWLSCLFSVFQSAGETHLLVLCEDVSARKEAEAALRKASAAVEQSPASIFITNTEGVIEYVNAAFTRMTGYASAEAVGKSPRILKSGRHEATFYQELWHTLLTGRTWSGRLCNRRKDGSLFWEEATISPLRNEAGDITHFVASKLDITSLVEAAEAHLRLQEQVARTQKLESLGSLAGGVAHDMNNVLGAILGLASVHQMLQPEGSALRRDMDTIVKACQRGGTLVKGLLGFARQGLAEAQEVDLNGLVREEVALLARTTLQRVQLDMDLAEGLPPVCGDASALSHALMNLCVNAVDAMEGGGTLSMRTAHTDQGFVLLEIADTGCGMAKEVLDRALDPFFTTKPQGKGTGLGLPIVYGTVKSHGGRMEIDSLPGRGTRVSIFLPAVTATDAPALSAAEHSSARESLAILLVDDDDLVRDSLEQLLGALGHRPTATASGEACLQELEGGLHPDLVILDLNMPGMGGAAALPRIRELRPQLPVLLATGRVDQEALDLVRDHPGVSLMPKPFTLAEVRRQLEPFCSR